MKTVALGGVAQFIRGVTFKPTDVADEPAQDLVGVMRTKNVQEELDLSDVIYIPKALRQRPDQTIRFQDTLISSANSWEIVGKCCWVPELSGSFVIGGFITGIRVTSEHLDARYLYRWLSSSWTQSLLRSTANQTTNIANLNLRRCEALEIPLPSLIEQRRIVEILDQSASLRAKHRQVRDHLDELGQSIYLDMFGDPLTDSPSQRSLGEVGEIVTGNTPSRAVARNYGDDGIEWIKSDNLGGTFATTAGERLTSIGQRTARVVPSGSVLVTCIAGSPNSIGKASLVDRDVAFNQQMNAIVPSAAINGRFLLEQLRAAPNLIRRKSTSGMKGLVSKSTFASIQVHVPPLDRQRRFAELAHDIDRMRAQEAIASTVIDRFNDSLQTRAFSGEL
jgi:type I restriction enzyme, S subunit